MPDMEKDNLGGFGHPEKKTWFNRDTRLTAEDKVSPRIVESYLEGLHYPANLSDMIRKAQENGAPESVIHTLEELPDLLYASEIEFYKAFGKL